jgi:hypothetical protein
MVIIIKKGATKDEIRSLLEAQKSETRKGVDIKKYCGIIQLREDPLNLQKKWRDEWE